MSKGRRKVLTALDILIGLLIIAAVVAPFYLPKGV